METGSCLVSLDPDLRDVEDSLRVDDVDRCQGRNAAEVAPWVEDLGIADLRAEGEVQTAGGEDLDPASCCLSSACSASSC